MQNKWTGRLKPARRPTSTSSKVIREDMEYHNPDPLVRLIGDASETNIIVHGVTYRGLVDSGAQISTITKSFGKALRFLKI